LDKIDSDKLEELILSESFREFAEGTNRESAEFWNNWISVHPEQKEEVENAVRTLKVLKNKTKSKVTADKYKSLANLLDTINDKSPRQLKTGTFYNSIWLKIAAVSLLVIGLASIWNTIRNPRTNAQEVAYNEIIVPLGEKAQIILSDGSHVWINSDSKLKYPVKFGATSRDIALEGEAFFDVARQNGKTFTVKTRDVKVNVLGTAFNVKCYPGDDKTQTTVVRGEVKVEDIRGSLKSAILKPNEMATLHETRLSDAGASESASIKVDKVDPVNLVSWKDQLLVFAGESFGDLAIKMERWFNVKIRINDEKLKSERYNGKFVHNETIYQVLEAIKITTPITYKVENDTIYITRKEE
jgi:transmembrane sensor